MMINTTEKLQEVCDRFRGEPFMCVDTEFVREKTYFPVVCLIQIAIPEEAYCIDPLAPEMDLTPLLDLMADPGIVKVFHAARQDIEIFYRLTGRVPAPVFDTQIGATVCGFRNSVGYQEIVCHYTGVSLDKSMRFTDWAKRPLSARQVKYALCDVTYLCDVYMKMKEQLNASGRLSWIEEDVAALADSNLYDPSDVFLCERLKYPILRPEAAHAYQALYLWREHKAREKNRPRRYILRDESLVELAAIRPQTMEEMAAMRGLPNRFERSDLATEILNVIQKAATEPPVYPIPKEKQVTLNRAQKVMLELLRLLLSLVCEENGVTPQVVADTGDLTDFIRGEQTRLTTGWRNEIFGRYAILLQQGKLLIGYDVKGKKTRLIESD